jgi:predicted solute-binding protein
VLNGFSSETLSIYSQFRNKISFYPVIEGAYVNTKIGTGKGLTCGPSLVKKHHSTGNSPQRIR